MMAFAAVYSAAGCLSAAGLSTLCLAARLPGVKVNYGGLWLACLLAWPIMVLAVPAVLGSIYGLPDDDGDDGGPGDEPGPPKGINSVKRLRLPYSQR